MQTIRQHTRPGLALQARQATRIGVRPASRSYRRIGCVIQAIDLRVTYPSRQAATPSSSIAGLAGLPIPEGVRLSRTVSCGGVDEGEPLIADGFTQGIVRIDDTVRRPLRPFSLTVQAYLAHLRDAGFTGAPLPLGIDEQGREVLSFVPGNVARCLLPEERASEEVLIALARLIRSLHDASVGWVPPPGAAWYASPASPTQPITELAELVSHRDYALGNVIFRGGLPAALIDFDFAKPTTRIYDIANALWYWAPLRDPRDRPPGLAGADIPHRVAVFADAYGMAPQQRARLMPMAVDMVRRYHQESRASAELDPVWRRAWEDGGGLAGTPGKVYLPRAEAWLREMAPAIAARLVQLS